MKKLILVGFLILVILTILYLLYKVGEKAEQNDRLREENECLKRQNKK